MYPDGCVHGGPFWLMVGVEVTRLRALPIAMCAKLLPPCEYAAFAQRLADGGFAGANEPIEAWSASSAWGPNGG